MGPDYLRQQGDRLVTSVGGCFIGEISYYRGYDLHKDLVDIEWFDLYLFGITGRRFPKNQLILLQTIWTYTSYVDSRIWNNRVAALAGSTRSTGNLATSAALAVSEAEIYGAGVLLNSFTFFTNANLAIRNGQSVKSFVENALESKQIIGGYSRPINYSADERILPIMELASSLNLDNGPHIKLAFDVEKILLRKSDHLKINYGGVLAALAADTGLSPQEFYHFVFAIFLAGMQPCYIEASERPPGAMFPTACDEINYEGIEKREWNPNKA